MKRSRVKVVGLGLALLAGEARAEERTPVAAPAVPPAPALLPAALRADWQPAGGGDVDAVWLPSRKPRGLPATPPVPAGSAVSAVVAPTVVTPDVSQVRGAVTTDPAMDATAGPRLANATSTSFPPLPEIPAIPDAAAGPADPASATVTPPASDGIRDWRPIPQPLPAATPVTTDPADGAGPRFVASTPDPLPMTMPALPRDPLPPPREVAPRPMTPPAKPADPEPPATPPARTPAPAERELPVAPPELMTPAGAVVPGNHGTFGSPPVRISKDYPPLRELIGHGNGNGWGRGAGGGEPGSPALDRLSFRAEYLLWWVNPQRIPALATTSTNGGFGFLGDPGTRGLLGPGTFGDSPRSGLRVRGGYWFDDAGTCGVDGSFFFLGRQSNTASFDSATVPTITRPFFSPNSQSEFGEIVALPNFASGTLQVEAYSSLRGFDVNLRHALCKTCDFRSEVFAGYRTLTLNEGLRATEFITSLAGNPNDPVGTRIVVRDKFETRNRFDGGQVGYAAERAWGRVSIDGRASVGVGNTHQTLDITGSQVRLRPGMTTPDTFAGGLLATGPNLGRFTRDRFSVVPEVALNLGYRVTPTVRAYVGYDFLYWSNVIRPGDQIDRVVDVALVPNPPPGVGPSGANRPQPTFRQSDLVVNGVQFGIEWRW